MAMETARMAMERAVSEPLLRHHSLRTCLSTERRTRAARGLRDSSHITAGTVPLLFLPSKPLRLIQGRLHMRRFVLIAAMVLASPSAHAGASRGLTLASNDEPAASTQPAPAPAAAPADAPKYVERPSAVDTKATEQ